MENRMFEVTYHSVERYKKRFNVHGDRRSTLQLIHEMKDAMDIHCFQGRKRNWLLDHSDRGCDAYVCKEKCMIVSPEGHIVTVYALPKWFYAGKAVWFGKERVRNTRAYMRNNRHADLFCRKGESYGERFSNI